MKDEIKEIYLSNLEWTKTHDNMGGVMGNIVFKDNMSYEEYQKLFKSGYFVLCDKDYITYLQKIEQEHKNCTRKHWQQKCAEHYANEIIYKSRCEEVIKDLKNTKKYNVKLTSEFGDTLVFIDIEHIDYLIEMLGGDNESFSCL